jgi:DNA polymerase-3 subunit gamma/tau
MTISEAEVQLVDSYSKNIDMQDIGLFWQLTIKTIDDLRIVGNENLTLEMYIMQLAHLQSIDNKKISLHGGSIENNLESKNDLVGKSIKSEKLESNLPTQVKNQLKNTDQIKTSPIKNSSNKFSNNKVEIKNFQDLIDLSNKEKEVELKFDLERNVKLVSFNRGKIDISFNVNLNKNFIKNLTEKLLSWTGERWIISLSKNTEAKSLYEQKIEKKFNKLEDFKKSALAKQIEEAFPDAKLLDIHEEKND